MTRKIIALALTLAAGAAGSTDVSDQGGASVTPLAGDEFTRHSSARRLSETQMLTAGLL